MSISSSTQNFSSIFETLGKAFEQLSQKSIIPENIISKHKKSKGKKEEIKVQEKEKDKLDKQIKKKIPKIVLDNNENDKFIGKKREPSNKVAEEEECESNQTSKSNFTNKIEENEKDNKSSTKEDKVDLSSKNEEPISDELDDFVFMDNEGWVFRVILCGLSIKMGPFISKKKALNTLNFLIKNKNILEGMEKEKRKKWVNDYSSLIENLLN